MVILQIKLKGNHGFSNIVANLLPADTPPPPIQGMGLKGQKSIFLEHGHVVYQITWNHEMQQHGRYTVEIVQIS